MTSPHPPGPPVPPGPPEPITRPLQVVSAMPASAWPPPDAAGRSDPWPSGPLPSWSSMAADPPPAPGAGSTAVDLSTANHSAEPDVDRQPATTAALFGSSDAVRPDTVEAAPEKQRWRLRFSSRARIVAWVLFALLLALGTVGVTLAVVLLNRVESEVMAATEQEMIEFGTFTSVGLDPETGQRFSDVRSLLRTHLARQYPAPNEIILGYANGAIRQSQEGTEDPFADPAVLRQVVDSPDSVGRFDSPVGEVYWNKMTVRTAEGQEGTFVTAYLLDAERQEAHDTIQLVALVSLLALAFSCLVAWVVAGRIVEPVVLVRKAAEEITEKRLDERIPVRGHDDIAELSRTFNAMLDRLDRAFGTQRQFVDDAGHELRTPITVIRGHLDVMGDDPVDRAETLALVDEELDRMNRIVDDLLVLARAEQPDFVRAAPVPLADLTTTVHTKMLGLGDRRWVLEAVAEEEVDLDQQRITQALLQLADNAVSHTRTGDTIRLGSMVGPGTVTFWVSDTGPGVPPGDLDTIFERFSRGSTGGAVSHTGGAGLGLSIVAAIAAAHGGRAWVANNPSGGARFGVEIPVQVHQQQPIGAGA